MKLVNVRQEPCTHYIGRRSSYIPKRHGIYVDLGNPIYLMQDTLTERRNVVRAYEAMVRSGFDQHAQRIYALPEDAVLGCWCSPKMCHGEAIIRLWKEMHNARSPV